MARRLHVGGKSSLFINITPVKYTETHESGECMLGMVGYQGGFKG